MARDLSALLLELDPAASLPQRHMWLIAFVDWIRGNGSSAAASATRVKEFLDAMQARPDLRERFQRWWQVLNRTVDSTMVLADHGFAVRNGFFSEAVARLRRKCLPQTPETVDAAELFDMTISRSEDVRWIGALDADTLQRLGQLLTARRPGVVAPLAATADGKRPLTLWQDELLRAMVYCSSQIRATGVAPELRLRMSESDRQSPPFAALAQVVDAFQAAYSAQEPAALESAAQALRNQLELCRQASASVYTHLDEHGISVSLVFMLRQLRERVVRVRELMDCLMSSTPCASAARLTCRLVQAGADGRSLRMLVQANVSLLAVKVTERSAETGEHYITRDRDEYRSMLRKSSGGGAITAVTTWFKFLVLGLGMTGIWSGMGVAVLYAISFVLIQLAHATLATKQPAMTAPAMAAKLKNLHRSGAIEDFVDEVTHLVRSQVAAVVGNVGLVVPGVLLISAIIHWFSAAPMIDRAHADDVFDSLSLLHPSTLLFGATTGVVLFASSLIAGATENWFVLRRLDSALRYNPRITALLGLQRADRWAHYLRENISGFASNIALGFLLGLVPTVTGFFGISIGLYHVTLSSGQIAAAAAALGAEVWTHAPFWWSVAAVPFIGLLNLSVSFYLALRLAQRAHNIGRGDRALLSRAVLRRMRQQPLSFLWPARTLAAPARDGCQG